MTRPDGDPAGYGFTEPTDPQIRQDDEALDRASRASAVNSDDVESRYAAVIEEISEPADDDLDTRLREAGARMVEVLQDKIDPQAMIDEAKRRASEITDEQE